MVYVLNKSFTFLLPPKCFVSRTLGIVSPLVGGILRKICPTLFWSVRMSKYDIPNNYTNFKSGQWGSCLVLCSVVVLNNRWYGFEAHKWIELIVSFIIRRNCTKHTYAYQLMPLLADTSLSELLGSKIMKTCSQIGSINHKVVVEGPWKGAQDAIWRVKN